MPLTELISHKICIRSNDRPGITYQILSVFEKHKCNLIALEMMLHNTFIHYEYDQTLNINTTIYYDLLDIDDVFDVIQIEWLPNEEKRLHLDTLLSNIPDPIFDINESGHIITVNKAAANLFSRSINECVGENISRFISDPLHTFLRTDKITREITIKNTGYFADITPIITRKNNDIQINGAVITLKVPERIGQQISALQQSNLINSDNMIGHSNAMQEVKKKAFRFAELDLPVLIRGETGTGKELLAKAIHQKSERSDAPFLAINCAAFPENLLESELFGYSAGAFTGASKGGKPGLFELANHGTVFLDELGEMSPYLQAKLLRFLQDYTFRRLGGTKEITVDVRIISATHRDLLDLSKQEKFREDLYYRMNVLSLIIPPLRERTEDIDELAHYFVDLAAVQTNREKCILTEDAIERLKQHNWPGNIRQLQNLLFRSVAITENVYITADELQFNKPNKPDNCDLIETEEELSLKQSMARYEKKLLEQLIPSFPTTRTLAKRLSVSHNTIALKKKEYQLD